MLLIYGDGKGGRRGGRGPGVKGEGLGSEGKGEMGDRGGNKVSLGRSITFLKGKIRKKIGRGK